MNIIEIIKERKEKKELKQIANFKKKLDILYKNNVNDEMPLIEKVELGTKANVYITYFDGKTVETTLDKLNPARVKMIRQTKALKNIVVSIVRDKEERPKEFLKALKRSTCIFGGLFLSSILGFNISVFITNFYGFFAVTCGIACLFIDNKLSDNQQVIDEIEKREILAKENLTLTEGLQKKYVLDKISSQTKKSLTSTDKAIPRIDIRNASSIWLEDLRELKKLIEESLYDEEINKSVQKTMQ